MENRIQQKNNVLPKQRILMMKKITIWNLIFLLSSSVLFSQNLVTNGDFESWIDTRTPSGWTKIENCYKDSDLFYSGNYACRHKGGTGTNDVGQLIPITGGESYRLSLWYNVVSGDGTDARTWSYWMKDSLELDQDALKLRPLSYFISDNQWHEYSVYLTAPDTATGLFLELQTGGGSFTHWDNVSLVSIPESPANFSVSGKTGTSISLSYDLNAENDSIIIVFSSGPSFSDPVNFQIPPDSLEGFAGGTVLYKGIANSITHSGLFAGEGYYYSIWSYDENYAYSEPLTLQAYTITPEPASHVNNFSGTPISFNAVDLSWNNAAGLPLPQGYFIVGYMEGVTDSLIVQDSTVYVNDMDWTNGRINFSLPFGDTMVVLNDLEPTTSYRFYIYPYTNSDTIIDYKTDGTIPSANITTGMVQAPSPILLSEFLTYPAQFTYVEIYNPTDSIIDLSAYYVTDATVEWEDKYYYNIVNQPGNAGGGTNQDFHAQFPVGSEIGPGEVQVIALMGSQNFNAEYGFMPDYELWEDNSEKDTIPDMEPAFPGAITEGLVAPAPGGEVLILYYWDGTSDLVTDIDYVVWGDKAEAVNKTGVSIDGPDGDVIPSSYLPETSIIQQDAIKNTPHTGGNSWQRHDFDEGNELSQGGNGVNGSDETSENLSETWADLEMTPGFITDLWPPQIAELHPVDNATGVGLDTTLVAVFDDTIQAGTGNIVIYNASADSIFEQFAISSLVLTDTSVIIEPSNDFPESSEFYVLIDSGAITDISDSMNAVVINSDTTWNFTTANILPPEIISLSPQDNSENINIETDFTIIFNEEITTGMGQIRLMSTVESSTVAIFDVPGDVDIDSNKVFVNNPLILEPLTGYHILIDSGTFIDLASNAFTGIKSATGWNFTTVDTVPSEVENIAALRDSAVNKWYKLINEVIITHKIPALDVIFVQDSTAAIEVINVDSTLFTEFETGDGLTGLTGVLDFENEFFSFNLLQFPDSVSSTSNAVEPMAVTITELESNFNEYEAELIRVEKIKFETGNEVFQANTTYDFINSNDTGTFYTYDISAEYLGMSIPDTTLSLTGIAIQQGDTIGLFSRSTMDMDTILIENVSLTKYGQVKLYPNPANDIIHLENVEHVGQLIITNVLGQQMERMKLRGDSNKNISLNGYKEGVYIITLIFDNDEKKNVKFIKE